MLGLFDKAATPRDGVNNVIRFILQSPSFIYVLERGTPVSGQPGVVALDDFEIAMRLSLLACETVPDATLLAAADAGQLHTPDQIAAQAKRVFAPAVRARDRAAVLHPVVPAGARRHHHARHDGVPAVHPRRAAGR